MSQTEFPRLFSPLQIGNFTVRNRLVNTTHGTALGEARDLRYLQERARGGVGFMGLHGSDGIFGYAVGPGGHSATPDWDGKAPSPVTDEGVAFYDNRVIPYLRKRADVIHAEGAACYAQMYHLGASPHAQRMYPALAPSAVADPYDALMPHPLTTGQIEDLIFAFAHGVRRIKEAGTRCRGNPWRARLSRP